MIYTVVGGAGAMGKISVTDLIHTAKKEDEIWVADYDFEKAEKLCQELKDLRLKAVQVNVKNKAQAVGALKRSRILINCTQYQFNLEVMEIALAIGSHYVDLGGLFHTTRKQLELHGKFKTAGLTAIVGVGAAPGITNMLSRLCADKLDTVTEIHTRVGSIDRTKYKNVPALPVSYSLKTILEEFSFQPAVFTKGKMTFVEPMSGDHVHEFPKPVGKQKPMYTIHSEVATLPLSFHEKGVKEVSFKIAFDPYFVDRVRFLRDLGMASEKPVEVPNYHGTTNESPHWFSWVTPIDVVNKVAMSQSQAQAVGKLNQYEVVRSVVKGTVKKKKVTLIADCHTSGIAEWGLGLDADTGCPPVVAAQMIADGKVTQSGVLAPEIALDALEFFERLKKRQMKVKVQQKSGWSFKV